MMTVLSEDLSVILVFVIRLPRLPESHVVGLIDPLDLDDQLVEVRDGVVPRHTYDFNASVSLSRDFEDVQLLEVDLDGALLSIGD